MLSRAGGVLLVLAVSVIWGSYPGIVKNSVEGLKVLPFMFVQHSVQICVALAIVLPQLSDIQSDFPARKFFSLFFAGVFSLLSDFLFLSSNRHLSTILTRLCCNIFADVYIGILIERFIPNDQVDMSYIVCGAVLYCAGLTVFIWSEYEYSKRSIDHEEKIITIKKKKKHKDGKKIKEVQHVPASSLIPKGNLDDIALHAVESGQLGFDAIEPDEDHDKKSNDEDEEDDDSPALSEIDFGVTFKDYDHVAIDTFGAPNPFIDHPVHISSPTKDIKPKHESILMINIDEVFSKSFGMITALLSGICLAMFFILSAVGMTGQGAVTSWITAYLFCQLGKIAALPIFLYFFGYWDPFDMFPSDERLSSIRELVDLNPRKLIVSIIAGIALSGSYAMIYYASTIVPYAIIDGLMTFETMVVYLMSFFVWGGYGRLTFPVFDMIKKPFQFKLCLGFMFSTAAMLTIALRAYTK